MRARGNDEYLERVVAGIQAVTAGDAEVTWNEIIAGRQFDVTVRFTVGTLRYLALFEVKDRTRAANASEIEAFVTKAHDQNANKMVFVTAAGFQSGAIEVAKRHAVDLFRVSFDITQAQLSSRGNYAFISHPSRDFQEPTFEIGEETAINQIVRLTLIYSDGRRADLPDEQSQMTYYAAKTRFGNGESLSQVVHREVSVLPELQHKDTICVSFPKPQVVSTPDGYYIVPGRVKAVEIEIEPGKARPLKGNALIEPSALQPTVVYENVMTGESFQFQIDELPLGMASAVAGKFYFSYHPLRYYYCDSVAEGIVKWHMVESFQNGELIRVTYTQKVQYSVYYIPVTDKRTIRRLEKRLKDYLALPRRHAPLS